MAAARTSSAPDWRARVRELEGLVGATVAAAESPYVEQVNPDAIRHFARAYGDDNPFYSDPAYAAASARGELIAPPLFPIATGIPGPPDARRRAVHGPGMLRAPPPAAASADRRPLHAPHPGGPRLGAEPSRQD